MIAFVFPGQGSQKVGMGLELCNANPAAAEVMAAASKAAGIDLLNLDAEALTQTRYAQLAIVAQSLAAYAAVTEELAKKAAKGSKAASAADTAKIKTSAETAYAGFSLGEYSALCAAGRLSLVDTMRLVARRAELMQQASAQEPGAMAAVIGLPAAAFGEILNRPEFAGRVYAVNDNAPGQMVIAGEKAAVAAATEPLKAAGARRIIPLSVSGAFHTRLMSPAAEPLRAFAAEFIFLPGQGLVFSNMTAAPLPAETDMPAYLAEHMLSPVLWRQEIEALVATGCTAFVECGSGKVLTGLIRKIAPQVPSWPVEDTESLTAAVTGLQILG